MKRLRELFLKNMKNNKLNFFTYTFAIIFFIVYIVGIVILLCNKYSVKNILSLSADYVTVVSCILVLMQLIAFVKDSRRNEFRSRKEAAYKIAREYAEDVLANMGFIQSVLAVSYDEKNPKKLFDLLENVRIDSFLYSNAKSNASYTEYISKFQSEDYDDIKYDTIMIFSVSYKIPGFMDIDLIKKEDSKKHMANIRFKSMIFSTLNTLECFAMSVNQNVSDSEMLYSSLHQTFLKFVRFVYPFICQQNIEDETFYPNIIKLFYAWNQYEIEENERKDALERKKQDMIKKNKTEGRPL